MKLPVISCSGKDTGKKVTLDKGVFGIEPHEHAVYLDVKHIMARKRQGTHKAKERGEIVGSTRKIKKQKGTGTARAGSIKSPLFRGGGKVFGPRPKNYSFKLNKKVKRLARKSVLSDKANSNQITILEKFSLPASKKTLLVLPSLEKQVFLASRNVPSAKVTTADLLNTYDLLRAQHLLISEEALERMVKSLNS